MATMATTEKQDAAAILAEHFVNTTYDKIPRQAVEAVKKSVLDSLGVSLAATTLAPGCKEIAELAREGGGKEESTIIGFGGRVPAWMAAFANGGLIHGLDYDDIHYGTVSHPSGPLLPAALAMAERIGNVPGRDFITAVALGQDMAIRMASAIPPWGFKWVRFPVLGVFAAAATCGKLLGLSRERIVNAIGIALCQSAGSLEIAHGVGSDLRGLYDAFPNKGGVLSALMAEKGIRGPVSSLEGAEGFFSAYYQGKYDREALIAGLGDRFEGADTGYKPWASCGNTHNYIDATLRLVEEHGLRPHDIESITVVVGDHARFNCEPLEGRRKPPTVADAKFSLPFTVATAAARRKVVLRDFTPEGIRDPLSLQLAQRVEARFDVGLNVSHGLAPGRVEIRTKDGRSFSMRQGTPRGHPQNPLTWDDLVAKFKDCASYSVKPLTPGNVEKVLDMASVLEQVDDVGRLMHLLG